MAECVSGAAACLSQGGFCAGSAGTAGCALERTIGGEDQVRGTSLQGRGDMSEITNVGYVVSAARYFPTTYPASQVGTGGVGGRAIRKSADGSAIAEPAPVSTLRAAYLQSIRSQIATGEYETPERIQGTVDRLLDVIA